MATDADRPGCSRSSTSSGADSTLGQDTLSGDQLSDLPLIGDTRSAHRGWSNVRARSVPASWTGWSEVRLPTKLEAEGARASAPPSAPAGSQAGGFGLRRLIPRSASLSGDETREQLRDMHDVARRCIAQSRSMALSLSDFGQIEFAAPFDQREAALHDSGQPSPEPAAELSVPCLSLLMVVFGCCCQAPVEVLATTDRGCGDLISFFEHAFGLVVSARGALAEGALLSRPGSPGGSTRRSMPLRVHAALAVLGVLTSKLFNLALASPLPAAVASSLKNGFLAANAVVGVAVLGKRYTGSQMAAVALVTFGLLCTARGGGGVTDGSGAGVMFGVACVCGGLLARALTGAVQEAAFHRYGFASAAEVLFYRNALGLPLFLLQPQGLIHHMRSWRADAVGGLPWPRVWVLLAANLVFDYACKVVMTRLIARAGALHATLALTVQKFTAFGVSVMLLEPALRLSPRLWLGAAAVLMGTIGYTKASAKAAAGSGSGPTSPVAEARPTALGVGEGGEKEYPAERITGRTQHVSADAARKKDE